MAQFARPDTDLNNAGSYLDQADGSTNLYTTVDEVSFSDADYIKSPTDPASAAITFRLSDVTDPLSSTGHVIRVRAGTDQASGGNQIDLTAQLRQGYTNEGSPGTLIATLTQTNISAGSFTDYSYSLSGAEADSITNYADLALRIVMNKP